MNLLDKCHWIAELSFMVSRKYRGLFNHEPIQEFAQHVLHDLAKFCGAYEMDVPTNKNDIAPLEMARRMGRLEVYQHITKNLRMSEQDKQRIASKIFHIENTNQENQGKEFI